MTAGTALDGSALDGAVRADPADEYAAYDFRRPAQLGREHLRRLEVAFESFARLWSSQLTAKVRVRAHFALERVELVSYDEYVQTLPTTTAMAAAPLGGREETCVLQFGLDSALLWVVQMMGGRPVSAPEPRTFTPIELALIRHLVEGALEHLSASLGSLLPGEPVFSAVHYNPQYLQVVPAGAGVIVARYTLRLGDADTTATVMLPASGVVARLAETGDDLAAVHTAEQTLAQVRGTPLDVALRLAPLRIAAGEVLELAPGDLLRFAHPETRPFELVAGGTPIARATAGSRGSRLACTITTVDEETL
ncbi:flagellar motor switch protein FliM [Microbacterium capsulatum]|uniref:Flagellar motor switch protein FliM n=1 Tax=Microbacterium capsulatum TaxID=3041921 RepID=A0ABU0XDQ5_9MICO|nr:flagellar motor switch protein FliM [Microbacterium sp. ASV81]MDQ4213208.1 flagellar motor switch protein FliM [Microbacterium sp. ASV81]